MAKKSYICFVYGQIYAAYVQSGKKQFFIMENLHVREWRNILEWLKRKQFIKDYALGDKIETACKLVVQGFNEDEKIYQKYLAGIDKNLQAV